MALGVYTRACPQCLACSPSLSPSTPPRTLLSAKSTVHISWKPFGSNFGVGGWASAGPAWPADTFSFALPPSLCFVSGQCAPASVQLQRRLCLRAFSVWAVEGRVSAPSAAFALRLPSLLGSLGQCAPSQCAGAAAASCLRAVSLRAVGGRQWCPPRLPLCGGRPLGLASLGSECRQSASPRPSLLVCRPCLK